MKEKKQFKQQDTLEKQIKEKYQIVEKIGSGAYGHVWKVIKKVNKKVYALKKIYAAFQNDTDAQRTYRQICILKKCEHPNIIKLHQIIKADNNMDLYLLFDYFDSDLFNAIRDNVLNGIHKKYIVYQIAKSLKYIHSAGIIHRDLKPSNVLLNQNCILKLCDFGLSRTLYKYDNEDPLLTQFIATRWYRAPQVLLGCRHYNHKADLWSFGCLIYELYTGKALLPGDDSLDQIYKLLEFKGFPNNQEKKSLKIDNIDFILSHFNISKVNNKNYFQEPGLQHPHLLQLVTNLLDYNPQNRWNASQILACKFLQQFKNFEQCPQSKNDAKLYPNDNKKLSVDVYRNLITKFFIKSDTPKRTYIMNFKNNSSLHLSPKSSSHKISSNSLSALNSPYASLTNTKRILRNPSNTIKLNIKDISNYKNYKSPPSKSLSKSKKNSFNIVSIKNTKKVPQQNKQKKLIKNPPSRRLKKQNRPKYGFQ